MNGSRGELVTIRSVDRCVERVVVRPPVSTTVLGAVHADRTPPLTGPFTEQDPFHDPFVMFASLAGITERIGSPPGF